MDKPGIQWGRPNLVPPPDSHELWAASQLAPTECIIDAVKRIESILSGREQHIAELQSQLESKAGWTATQQNCINEANSRVEELEARLRDIGDIAHEQSTGPAEVDWLWHIRELAYELL